jgi:uncharacterized protein (TIGR00251 family)
VLLRIRAQPKASRTELAGEHGDALKIRIAAPPVDGEANRELLRFLAKRLHVTGSSIRVVSGESGRNKVIEVQGTSPTAILAALNMS